MKTRSDILFPNWPHIDSHHGKDEGKHVKLLNIERPRRRRQSILQLHKQLSSFSLNCCFLPRSTLHFASMSISHSNKSISFCPRERSSVRTHVRLTTNDLCINYMASDGKRKEIWSSTSTTHFRKSRCSHARSFGGGELLNDRRTSTSSVVIAALRRLMVIQNYVPSLRRSSLNLICILKRKSQRLRSVFFSVLSRNSLCACSVDCKPRTFVSNECFLKTLLRGSFMQCAIAIIWLCRRRKVFFFVRLRNCDIFTVSLATFVLDSHGEWLHAFMASDYASVLPFNVV